MTLARSVLLASVALALAGPVQAASPIRLADHIPADSLLYLEIPSFPAFERVAREGCAARILAHPEIRQAFGVLLDQAKGNADQFLAMGLSQIGIALEDLERLVSGGLAIALSGIEPGPGGPPMPHLYVSIEAKGTDEEVWGMFERLAGALGEGSIEVGPIQDGIRAATGEGMGFFASRIGGSLVLSLLAEDLAAMRDRAAAGAKVESPLSAAPGFLRAAQTIGESPLLIAYANVAGIWGIVSQFAEASPEAGEAIGIATLAGIPSIGSAALGLAWGKGEGIATAYLDFPNGRSGIFAIPGDEKLDPAILGRIPANAFYACAGGWDPAGSFDRFLALAGVVPPLKAFLDEKLPVLEETFGIEIRDFLATIGAQQASWQAFPSSGGLLPEGGAAIRLKDPQGFRRALEALCGKTGGELREIEAAGRTILVAEMPFLQTIEKLGKTFDESAPSVDDMLEGVEGPDVARAIIANMTTQTAMCLDGDTLLVADTPYALRSYLAGRRAGGAASLPSDGVFARTAEGRLAGQSGFIYLRVDPLARAAYNTLVPIAQIVAGGALRRMAGVNLAALPTADFLQKELAGALVTYRVDPQAMEIKANGTAGAVALGGAALLAGFAAPSFLTARGRAQEVQCMSNLQVLGMAATLYANDDADGALPSGAGAPALLLEKGYLSDAKTLICPSSGREPADLEEEPCYLWIRAKVKRSDDPMTPIACDAMPWHGGKRNVLFLDMHVESVDEGVFIEKYAKFFEE